MISALLEAFSFVLSELHSQLVCACRCVRSCWKELVGSPHEPLSQMVSLR